MFSNEIPDEILNLYDFITFRKDRADGNDAQGGVLSAVEPSLNHNMIYIDTDLEVYFITLNVLGLTLKLGVVYRPQSFNRNNKQTCITS